MASQRVEGELRFKVASNIEHMEAKQTILTDFSWLTQVSIELSLAACAEWQHAGLLVRDAYILQHAVIYLPHILASWCCKQQSAAGHTAECHGCPAVNRTSDLALEQWSIQAQCTADMHCSLSHANEAVCRPAVHLGIG